MDTLKYKNNVNRVYKTLIILISTFIILIVTGTVAFKYMFDIEWIDALMFATLVLCGVDLEISPVNKGQKIFIVIYAILSIVVFLSMASAVVDYLFAII